MGGIRVLLIALVLATLTAAGLWLTEPEPDNAEPAHYWSEVDREFLELVNQARAQRGVKPLQTWDPLASSRSGAAEWSYMTMNVQHIWHDDAHISAGMQNAGCLSGGENVSYTSRSGSSTFQVLDAERVAQELFAGYMGSPGHRANLLRPHYGFHGSGTVVHRFATASGTDYVRVYHTHRFGVDCRSDQMPQAGADGPTGIKPPPGQPLAFQEESMVPAEEIPHAEVPDPEYEFDPDQTWLASMVPTFTIYSASTLILLLTTVGVTMGVLQHRRLTARRMLTMTQFRPEASALLLPEGPSTRFIPR
ncbi:CAP domain-containing protein [Nesterenkonia populi]|uniref:CAP domain-containing protein n=1 Tax=Nesterenkonia populi TaxID=1591087 RepID=UPI0011BDF582|nr:CAP domain-containing protein [Nesterenkonia populi]